jgi:integrase
MITRDGSDILDEILEKVSRPAARRPRGFGLAYRRGRIWWVRYYVQGREHRESTGTIQRADAERLLKARWKQIGAGRFVGPREERVTMGELFDALVEDYRQNGRRSLATLGFRLAPLREAFGLVRASEVRGADVERYKVERLAAKSRRGLPVAPATLNRELAALRRAFRLAIRQERLAHAPAIALLAEHNVRQGFVDVAGFERLAAALPEPLDDVARFAYSTGWRKGEVLTLAWPSVDLAGRRIWLRREHSKTEQPRVIVLQGELLALMERHWAARLEGCPLVFHRGGAAIVDLRKPWKRAARAAGLPALRFHDLRRSAVRNLDKAGVSETVAMHITGHKTASVYRRYRIVDEQDVARALGLVEAAAKRDETR